MGRKNKPVFYEQVALLAGGGEGHSIAKINGKVVFVKYGAPGDIADIRIIGRKKRFDIAKIEKIHQSSEIRTMPFCTHYGVCGGCKWQHLEYEAQASLKEQWARDCLERIGKLDIQEYLPIAAAEKHSHYRNKMEYTFSDKRWLYEHENLEDAEHTNALGFHATGRFDKVIDIDKCWLQDDPANDIRNFVRNYALENGLSFYDLKEHKGFLRNLILRNTREGNWMIILITAGEDQSQNIAILEAIRTRFKPESLNYAVNNKLNDSIYDLEIINYSGKPYIVEKLYGLEFMVHPKSFFQTNTIQAEKLYSIALDFAGITNKDVIYDLYCGTGTITLAAALKAKKAIGVDIVEDAIDAARLNAKINRIENALFVTGDMKDVFNQEFYALHGAPDLIIVDPPRSGMHPKVLEQLCNINTPKIVYVSCNPATQARDLEILSDKYHCLKSQAVDMFPQTHHVENVVLLKSKTEKIGN